MVRFLARMALMVLANAGGLIIARVILPGLHIDIVGFTLSVLVFTGIMLLFEPFVLKMAIKYMPVLRGGIALVTTFVGLFLTTILTSGLRVEGLTTWVLAPLVIWISVIIMGIVLPMVLFKNILSGVKEGRSDGN